MRITNLFLAIIIIFTSGCDHTYRLSIENQVYEALFNEIIQDATKVVIIGEETELILGNFISAESFLAHHPNFSDVAKLFDLLVSTNKTRYKINYKPIMVNGYLIEIPRSSKKRDFQENLIKKYGTRSYYEISKVVFDPDTKDALVAIANNCGALCGFGAVVHLRKEGVIWRIVKTAGLWIS